VNKLEILYILLSDHKVKCKVNQI